MDGVRLEENLDPVQWGHCRFGAHAGDTWKKRRPGLNSNLPKQHTLNKACCIVQVTKPVQESNHSKRAATDNELCRFRQVVKLVLLRWLAHLRYATLDVLLLFNSARHRTFKRKPTSTLYLLKQTQEMGNEGVTRLSYYKRREVSKKSSKSLQSLKLKLVKSAIALKRLKNGVRYCWFLLKYMYRRYVSTYCTSRRQQPLHCCCS